MLVGRVSFKAKPWFSNELRYWYTTMIGSMVWPCMQGTQPIKRVTKYAQKQCIRTIFCQRSDTFFIGRFVGPATREVIFQKPVFAAKIRGYFNMLEVLQDETRNEVGAGTSLPE